MSKLSTQELLNNGICLVCEQAPASTEHVDVCDVCKSDIDAREAELQAFMEEQELYTHCCVCNKELSTPDAYGFCTPCEEKSIEQFEANACYDEC